MNIRILLANDTAEDRQAFIAGMRLVEEQPADWAGTPLQWAKRALVRYAKRQMANAAESAVDTKTARAAAEARVDESVTE